VSRKPSPTAPHIVLIFRLTANSEQRTANSEQLTANASAQAAASSYDGWSRLGRTYRGSGSSASSLTKALDIILSRLSVFLI